MSPPSVAIVGRANVGKSTLFNALAGRRISIVEPTSGVTRDRVSTSIRSADGARLELIDTGGMGIGGLDALARHVEAQIDEAVRGADVFVLVVDCTAGLVPQDREIATRLRKLGRPVVLVANKAESARTVVAADEFHALGLGEPLVVSALHRRNTGILRDRLFELAGAPAPEEPERPTIKLAVVGQRNVGKSTFINALANEDRVIVSEVPGTTRDAVDVRLERGGTVFVTIDTAGIRKKRRVASSIEFYSRVRAEESIRRADVVLLLIDAERKISQVDKHLADYIEEHLKPCVIVVNKWDLAGAVATGKYVTYLNARLPGLRAAPIAFVSALKRQRVHRTLDLAASLWKQANTRVSTSELNRVIEELKNRPHRSGRSARRPKIYYATQVRVAPPTIVLFVNSPKHFGAATRRFVRSFLRTHLPFEEVPLAVHYRKAETPGR